MELAGRTVVITGANTGIGRVTALDLGRRGARVILAGRSEEKTRPVLDELARLGARADFVPLDLSDLASVRQAAAQVLSLTDAIHILVNNAGLAGKRGTTQQGFELTFGTNHLGPFLFTNLLLDRIKASAPARIVNVASVAHYQAPGIDFDALRQRTPTVTGFPEYKVSKLCNVLFTRQLARRLEGTGVTVYSLHPGVIASDIWRSVPAPVRAVMKLFMDSPEDGAKTSIYCATDPAIAGHSGRYYTSCREKRASKLAQDDALARTLWDRSEEWTR